MNAIKKEKKVLESARQFGKWLEEVILLDDLKKV